MQVCDSDTMLDPAATVEMVKVLEVDHKVGGVGGDVKVHMASLFAWVTFRSKNDPLNVHFSSVQSLSRVQLFVIPSIAARQASLSITNSWSLLKLMPIESVMPSSHLILCHPLLLLPPIPPSIRVLYIYSIPNSVPGIGSGAGDTLECALDILYYVFFCLN